MINKEPETKIGKIFFTLTDKEITIVISIKTIIMNGGITKIHEHKIIVVMKLTTKQCLETM